MAAVWRGMSSPAVFLYILFPLFLLFLVRKDRRYCWIFVGAAAGSIFFLVQQESLKRDLYRMKQIGSDTFYGEILNLSKTKSGKRAITLKNDDLEGKILLYDSGEVSLRIGDEIRFEGRPEVWEKPSNPGQFSSRDYYFAKGIYYHSYSDKIEVLRHRKAMIDQTLYRVREFCAAQIQKQYQGDVRQLVQSMVLGDKTELSVDVKDDFRESGLIHLLAVSGLHISLVGRNLYRLIRKIGGGFLLSSLAGIFLSCFYCLLTGASISSIRAVWMFGIYCLAQITGECYDMLSSTSFAGVLILSVRPFSICDTGFVLSFTAVIVIGWYQIIKPDGKRKYAKLFDAFLFCVIIQLGMFPVIIYFQYETPILSFLANLAAVPVASWAFFAAVVTLLIPGVPIHWIIQKMFEGVLWISRQSYVVWTVGEVSVIWVFLFYGVLVLLTVKNVRISLGIRICLIYTGIFSVIAIPMFRKNTIAFLDVGQGDCMIARTDAGLVMSDGGSSSEDQVGKYRILPYMKYCGYSKIKIAVISHLDLDHYSGILELLKMGKIEYLGLPENFGDENDMKIRKIAGKTGTVIFTLSAGQMMKGEGISLEVLHPKKNTELEKNAASLVLQGQLLGYQVLLTGDVEKEGEQELLQEKPKEAEILKVAHHGSKNSTAEAFLNLTNPKISVISCGKGNRYGHPHRETLTRLRFIQSQIRRTDLEGAVIFEEKEGRSLKKF